MQREAFPAVVDKNPMIMIKCRAHFAGGDTRLDLPPSPIVTSDLSLCLNAVFIGDNLCIYGSSFGSDVFFGNNMLPRAAGSVLCERTAFWDNEGFRRRNFYSNRVLNMFTHLDDSWFRRGTTAANSNTFVYRNLGWISQMLMAVFALNV